MSAYLAYRVLNKSKQICFLESNDRFHDWINRSEKGRLPVAFANLIQDLLGPGIRRNFPLPNVEVIGIVFEREGKYTIGSVLQEPVSVDPPFLGVFDIVVDHEHVDGSDQLKVPQIR